MVHSKSEVWLQFASAISGSTKSDINHSLAFQIATEADNMTKQYEQRFPTREQMIADTTNSHEETV